MLLLLDGSEYETAGYFPPPRRPRFRAEMIVNVSVQITRIHRYIQAGTPLLESTNLWILTDMIL